MSDSNQTWYSGGNHKEIWCGSCMSSIRLCSTKFNVYIPFKNLNKGITDDVVSRWVEFGNKTFFQASLTKVAMNHCAPYRGSASIIVADAKNPDNAYKIEIDCSKIVMSHRLAILTFYRYLYSNLYDDVVPRTIKLMNLGINPWDALYYVLSAFRYDEYYSLLKNPGFKTMDEVMACLTAGNSVNKSFSATDNDLAFTKMNVDNLPEAVEKFKLNEIPNVPDGAIKLYCIVDYLMTVTWNKTYYATIIPNDPYKYNIIRTDYGRSGKLLKSHFVQIK